MDEFDPLSIDQAEVNKALTGCPDCVLLGANYFSRDDARDKVFAKLAEVLNFDPATDFDEEVSFPSLGFDEEKFREFEKNFIRYLDEIVDLDGGWGSIDFTNEPLPPIPDSLEKFIDIVYRTGKGHVISSCGIHSIWP